MYEYDINNLENFYRMDYRVCLYYQVLYDKNLKTQQVPKIQSSTITSEGNTYGTQVIQGSSGFNSATVGLKGFQFDLFPLFNNSIFSGKPGRYLESLTFKVADVLYSTATNQFAFDWEMGYYTTLTTFPSNGAFSMSPVLLQLASSSSTVASNLSPATGAVCVDDKFFKW